MSAPRAVRSLVAPLLLIGIGALFLARNVYPDLPLLDYLARYWPFLLILWGGLRLVEILVWYGRGQTLPARGITGGEWTLAIFLCFLGGSIHAARGFADWLPNAGVRMGGLDVFGESFEYPLGGTKATGKSPRIVIEGFRGNARVVGGDVNEVKVTGHKTVRSLNQGAADRTDKDTPFEVLGDENRVVIRTNQDRAATMQRITADLEISVPRGASVEARGRYGDFDISSLDGSVDINSDNAGVRVDKIGGEVHIDVRRSDIVRAMEVKGGIDIKGRGAEINLENVAGTININGSFSGLTEIHSAAKAVHFVSPFTEFHAERVPGDVRIGIGDLSGSNVVGPVRLTASRNKDVRLTDVSNSLEIALERGDIQITAGAAPVPKIDAHTRFGEIELALAPGARFDLTASSGRGEVENQFGSPLTFESSRKGGTLRGSNGGAVVSVHTDRGRVVVRKALASEGAGKQLKAIEQ